MSSELVDWAQCELCKKWRKLPIGMNPETLPDQWVCSMNTWDSLYSSCSALEEIAVNSVEMTQSTVSERVSLNSEVSNRALKGRKKGTNSFANINTNPQNHSNKVFHAPNSNSLEEAAKISENIFSLNSLFSKGLIDELKHWTSKLEKKDEQELHAFSSSEGELPSCWPVDYRGIGSIFLVRNKCFEQFEKLKAKASQNSMKGDFSINPGISQNYPICIFKSKMPILKTHPLHGRTLITGTEIPIIFESLNDHINGLFPAFPKDQISKGSNNVQLNTNYSSNILFKCQNSVSTGNSILLELIPALKSDWSSPSLDLSNSLFFDNDDFSNYHNFFHIWNLCGSSYKALFPTSDYSKNIPSYINNTVFKVKDVSNKNDSEDINEYLNVDILDLLPLFSWLEDSFNGVNSVYPKSSHSNMSTIYSQKVTKKYVNKAIVRNKIKTFDSDQLEDYSKIRRSSRNISRSHIQEKLLSDTKNEIGLISGSGLLSKIEKPNELSSNLLQNDQVIQGVLEIDKAEFGCELSDKELLKSKNESDTIILDLEVDNSLESIQMEDNSSNYKKLDDNFELNPVDEKNFVDLDVFSKNGKEQNSFHSQELEKSDSNTSNIFVNNLNETSEQINVLAKKESIIINEQCAENFSDDEFNLPMLGSHKRKKTVLEMSKLSDLNIAQSNINETNSTFTKGRLKKKPKTLSNKEVFYCDHNKNQESMSTCDTNSKSLELSTSSKDAIKVIDSIECNKDHLNDKKMQKTSTIQIIPKKRLIDNVDRMRLGSHKGDPWIPVSDSSSTKRDLQVDDSLQQNSRAKSSNWQIDQKRQRPIDQKRGAHGVSSIYRSHYQKYRNSIHETHDKGYSRYRNYSSFEQQNLHSCSSSKKTSYYDLNVTTGQVSQCSAKNESTCTSHNNRNYYSSKHCSLNNSSLCLSGSTSRYYRPKANEY